MSTSLALAPPETPSRELGEEEIKILAVRASSNDPAAFSFLYRLYFPQVFTFINFRVSCREDAEDLTNAVFEKALAAIERYRPKPAQFSPGCIPSPRTASSTTTASVGSRWTIEADAAVVPSPDSSCDPVQPPCSTSASGPCGRPSSD